MTIARSSIVCASLIAAGLLGGCFSAEVARDLPCSNDATCGPDLSCIFGYCRDPGTDPMATCGDGQTAQGEFCFPESTEVEVGFVGTLRDAVWADFDGNGYVDALTVSEALDLQLNGGDRTFESINIELVFTAEDIRALGVELQDPPMPPVEQIFVAAQPRTGASGNFSGDSLPDVVLAMEFVSNSDALVVTEGLGRLNNHLWIGVNDKASDLMLLPTVDSDFEATRLIGPRSLVAGDFDGDGNGDVVAQIATGSGAEAVMMRGSGNSSLSNPIPLPLTTANPLSVGDFNADGIDDLAAYDAQVASFSVVLGPLDGPDEVPVPQTFSLPMSPSALELADLDGDGNLDILVGFGEEGLAMQPWLGDGAGEFVEGPLSTTADTSPLITLATTDFDGDGNLDVVTSSNDGLFIHPGYGEGEFGTGFALRDVPTTLVESFQLDSDTAPDIITFSPNRAALLFGDP
ncbi:MAG: VCBS repeat-containing protein [Myxococcota bacterium]